MSEPENFLSRWSRKQARGRRGAGRDARSHVAAAATRGGAGAARAPLVEEPAFDLAKLPSLDRSSQTRTCRCS